MRTTRSRIRRAASGLALAAAAASPAAALAAGFAIIEQSVSGLGNAFAGGAASASDASTVFFNPAGLTHLEDSEFEFAAHIISPSTTFTDEGSNIAGVFPLSGGDGGDAGVVALVPNLYYTRKLDERLYFGLGINAPFGLKTEWDRGWVGRYHAVESEVKTINIQPSFAYRAGDHLSVGLGFDLQYIEGTLSNAVDFASVCQGFADFGFPTASCAGLPQSSDGFAEVTGSDWSGGLNLGLLYDIDDATRVGLHYRSPVFQNLSGDARFENVPAELLAIGAFVDTDASLDIALPESVSGSIWRQVNDRLALMADITWTRWSRFDRLVIDYDQGLQGNTVQAENWDDSLRYAIGADYAWNDQWTLRAGLAYDETPIPSAAERTPRIPGNDRTWVAIGAGYRVADTLSFDAAYAHLFVDQTPIENTNALGATLVGTFDSSVDILSAQLNWRF